MPHCLPRALRMRLSLRAEGVKSFRMISVQDEHRLPPLQKWRAQAACRGLDASVFFPDDDGEASALAKATCASCVVQDTCLSYALMNKEKAGVWGGATERERRRIIRQARRKSA